MFQVRLYAASASIRIRTLMGDASGRAPRTDADTRIWAMLPMDMFRAGALASSARGQRLLSRRRGLNTDAKTVADTNRDSSKHSTTKRVPKGCSQ